MTENARIPHVPDYATPPGWVIEGYMESYEVSKEELARHLGLELAEVERLLAGNHPITPEIAAVLGGLFHHSTEFWLNMEAGYQQDKKRLESRNGKRPRRKPNPSRRYSIVLPNALGRELDARAKAAGVTSYRWIVNTLTRALKTP